MRPIGPDLTAEQQDLGALLDRCAASDWELGTRCDGWTVADVVLHLAQTNEAAVASITGQGLAAAAVAFAAPPTGGDTVDDRVDAMVVAERGLPPSDIDRRWRTSANELDAAVADADPRARVPWVAGEMSVRTLATTRLAETWIHADDVADALGVQRNATDRLWHVARLAWRTLPYAFERAGARLSGPVGMRLRAPSHEEWLLQPDADAVTTVVGDGTELCLVAARRVEPSATRLVAEGPDAPAVLELIRTYA
jgi:uncharacterized protein (TIGR03084 family)